MNDDESTTKYIGKKLYIYKITAVFRSSEKSNTQRTLKSPPNLKLRAMLRKEWPRRGGHSTEWRWSKRRGGVRQGKESGKMPFWLNFQSEGNKWGYLVGAETETNSEPGKEQKYHDYDTFLCSHGRSVRQVVGLEQDESDYRDRDDDGVVEFEVQEEVQREGAQRQGASHYYLNQTYSQWSYSNIFKIGIIKIIRYQRLTPVGNSWPRGSCFSWTSIPALWIILSSRIRNLWRSDWYFQVCWPLSNRNLSLWAQTKDSKCKDCPKISSQPGSTLLSCSGWPPTFQWQFVSVLY